MEFFVVETFVVCGHWLCYFSEANDAKKIGISVLNNYDVNFLAVVTRLQITSLFCFFSTHFLKIQSQTCMYDFIKLLLLNVIIGISNSSIGLIKLWPCLEFELVVIGSATRLMQEETFYCY